MSYGTITAGQLVLTGSQDYIPRRVASKTLLAFQAKSDSSSDPLVTQWTSSGATVQDQLNGTQVTYSSSGARAVLQSLEYVWCPPSRGNVSSLTILMQDGAASSASQAGVRIRVGVFDDGNDKTAGSDYDSGGNGYFLEFDSGTFYVVERTSNGTTQSDSRVSQSSWNMSTVPSLDVSAPITVIVDREGASRGLGVRIGFAGELGVVYAHSFDTSSTSSSRTKRLPLRFEVQNYSVSNFTNAPKSRLFDAVVTTSPGDSEEDLGRHLSYVSDAEVGLTGTPVPVLSISTDGSHERQRVAVEKVCAVNVGKDAISYEIVIDGTLTGAAWVSQDGVARIDTSATALTGGTVVASGFCGPGSDFARDLKKAVVSWSVAGAPGSLTVVARTVRSGGSTSSNWALSWVETA